MLINGIKYYTLDTTHEIEFELDNNTLNINDKVILRMNGKNIDTTAGRLLIYTITGIIINYELDSKNISRFISEINKTYSNLEAARIIKELENIGLKYSTKSGISICVDDLTRDEKINEYMSLAKTEIKQAPKDEQKIWDSYLNKSVDHWIDNIDPDNSMYIMMKSGARVKPTQIRQMIVAKGLLTNMKHTLNEYAIEASLTDGLSPLDYFNTCGPARQGLASNFFVVPISGYLERQLVDVCKELVITIEDCGTNNTISIPLNESLGRYDKEGNLIDEKTIKLLSKLQDNVEVRSPTTCSHNRGLCQKCCGSDPSTKLQYWNFNTNIGVIAAQTISEKSTQLALRGKHTSGSATIKEFENKVTDGILRLYKMLGASGNAKMGGEQVDVPTFKDIVSGQDYITDVNKLRIELQNIVSLSGDGINSSFLEIIIRGISDIVKVDNETIIRSYSDYNMLDNIEIKGIFGTIKDYPSWIKSASHRGFKSRIINELTDPSYLYHNLPSERILRGSTYV